MKRVPMHELQSWAKPNTRYFSHKKKKKKMVQFCSLGIYLGIETTSCRLLQRR